MKLRPSEFQPGDYLNGEKIVGKEFIRGGVRVWRERADGSMYAVVLNGRFKFEVERKDDR